MNDKLETVELEVEGMTCTNCALSVQKMIEKGGAQDVYVNFATHEARFKKTPETSLDKIIKNIEGLGYNVVGGNGHSGHNAHAGHHHASYDTGNDTSFWKLKTIQSKFWVSLVFTIPLLLHMVSDWAPLHDAQVQFVLCLPVMLIGISHFGRSAWSSVRSGVPNMDVLIFLGSTAAFVYSLWGSAMYYGTHEVHQYLFYETAASIITLVLLGNLIEDRAVKRTTTAVEELNKLQPRKVKKILFDLTGKREEIQETDLKNIKVGDVIQATTGDGIAVDGEVVKGSADIDESAITGESVPVFKEAKARVVSGTVVENGSINYKATAVGSDTLLAKITEAVKDAQMHKPPIQKFADKVSAIFVPVVLGISLITFIINYFFLDISAGSSLLRAIGVLVISCPCAMGLATPTAIMVGLGRAAKNQVLIKGSTTLEELGKIKTVVFDKTGTLTTGKFRIANFQTFEFEDFVAKALIYNFEKISNHPIAKSIIENYKDWEWRHMDFSYLEEEKGKGLRAGDVTGLDYRLGNREFIKDVVRDIPVEADLYLTRENRVIASFDIEDYVRPEAKRVVDFFKSKGITPVLLSGDNEKKCRFVAEKLGISEFYHSQLPDQKLAVLKTLSNRGKMTMVGDGINDAPALSLADIGISLSGATDAARQSAGIVLISDDLQTLVKAYHVGTKTYSTIRQNLMWALAYNIVAIPMAALGFLSPMLGALSMAFSDVVVIGNSLRLRWKKI